MGGHPYKYVVPWQPDITKALEALRADVFARGEYLGAEQGFATPAEALEKATEEGTRSILDITKIGDEPAYLTASSLDDEELAHHFGSTKPSLVAIENSREIYDEIDRGMARYIIAYEDGEPKHIVFMGYSYD